MRSSKLNSKLYPTRVRHDLRYDKLCMYSFCIKLLILIQITCEQRPRAPTGPALH